MNWNSLNAFRPFPRKRSRSDARRNACRPGIEQLEDRSLPSVSIPTYQEVIIDPNPNPPGPLETGLGNLAGNGRLDAYVGIGNWNGTPPGGMYWYENPGNVFGTWTKHTITTEPGNFYERSAAVNLAGHANGVQDIIASESNQLVWFQNPGDLSSNPDDTWTKHFINYNAGAHDLKLADLLGNGKVDVIASGTGAYGANGYIAFQGNSPDQWTIVNFGNPGDSIALYDDGSGYGAINLVGVDQNTNNLVYWQNPREFGGNPLDGSQWVEHVIQANVFSGPGGMVQTGYFTQSGRMDVVVGANEGGLAFSGLYWYQNLGGGNFQQHLLDSSYIGVHQINIADMNNDGTQDIQVCEEPWSPQKLTAVF
jgi:hypothetical protein